MNKHSAPEWTWWRSAAPDAACVWCGRPEYGRAAITVLGERLAGPVWLLHGIRVGTTDVIGTPMCADHLMWFVQLLVTRRTPVHQATAA